MRSARSRTALILLATLAAAPVARAHERMAEESPDPGFRVLAPRTVVSFVRQSLPGPAPAEMRQPTPRFNTLVHVSNTGSGMLGGVAIFVNARGDERRAMRFRLAPGQTGSRRQGASARQSWPVSSRFGRSGREGRLTGGAAQGCAGAGQAWALLRLNDWTGVPQEWLNGRPRPGDQPNSTPWARGSWSDQLMVLV